MFFGTKTKEVSEKWIMTNCPFARWTHPDGDDRRFSFGISTDNGFNCFTCGLKGHILSLPRLLARYSHIPWFDLEDYIRENLSENDFTDDESEITYLHDDILKLYEDLPEGYLNLSKKDIKKWQVKYDRFSDIAIFPIFLNGKINALKMRGISKKFFYVEGKLAIKKTGNWYGDWLLRNPKFIFLVEGERDAILLSRYVPAIASLGIPTKAQFEYIQKNFYSIPVILFFDNDKAGVEMKRKAIRYLAGMDLFEVSDYCGCKDPAEIIEKNLIRQALQSIKKL